MMSAPESSDSPASAQSNSPSIPYPSERYAWYVVIILMIVYVFSFVDRQILSLLVDPIKADLGFQILRSAISAASLSHSSIRSSAYRLHAGQTAKTGLC